MQASLSDVATAKAVGEIVMSETRVYPGGDNHIEISGMLSGEFLDPRNRPMLLAFSDGTLIEARKREDQWRLRVVERGACEIEYETASADDDPIVTLTGPLRWCVWLECNPYRVVRARP